MLVGLLSTGRQAVKKKAIVALGQPPISLFVTVRRYLILDLFRPNVAGALVTSSSPKIFTSLSKTLITTLASPSTSAEVSRAYIQLIGTLSRSAPQKTGQALKEVMPAILKTCKSEDDEGREVGLAVSVWTSTK